MDQLPCAEVSNEGGHVILRLAPPLTLHGDEIWRTDGNSPVMVDATAATAFFSHYEPRGRTFRRRGSASLRFERPSEPVQLIADPDPEVGKWIEAVWQAPDGRLHGWYHAEERAPCPRLLFVPHIGGLVSDDDGRSWRFTGELMRAPSSTIDCSYRNGFFAGGYGDLSVLPDRAGRHLYIAFTSYLSNEAVQGVVMARQTIGPSGVPGDLELWSDGAWRPAANNLPTPLWRPIRGWRHPDPDSFWGPAVHFNRSLNSFVMLLNRTAGGHGDLVQEGIYLSFNTRLDDPNGWSRPLRLARGGAWYPQVVGLEAGDGDAQAGKRARYFMAGFSAWEIEFGTSRPDAGVDRPLAPSVSDFTKYFGVGRKSPW
jgi:hypothetical protein